MRDDPIIIDLREAYLLAVCAVRYSLGRMTYIVSDTCQFVTRMLPWFHEGQKQVLARDICDHARYGYSFGHECDRVLWMKLLDDLNEGLPKKQVLPDPPDWRRGHGDDDEGCPKREERTNDPNPGAGG